jgi:hypothetical protein
MAKAFGNPLFSPLRDAESSSGPACRYRRRGGCDVSRFIRKPELESVGWLPRTPLSDVVSIDRWREQDRSDPLFKYLDVSWGPNASRPKS